MGDETRIGLVGLSGYAQRIFNHLKQIEQDAVLGVRLGSIYVPNPDEHAETLDDLASHGVRVCSNYEDCLGSDIDAVWLPVPIHLHRSMTEMALEAGKAVVCEKPAAATVDDVDAMIDAQKRANQPVLIAFQDMYDPTTAAVKRCLLDGAIGDISHATLHACWPRDHAYYARNRWAGTLRRGNSWVLDGPAQNALAHYIMLGLFLLGDSFRHAAEITAVESELYRVNQIESYDTCSIRIQLVSGQSFLVLLTHASREQRHPAISIHGSHGQLRWGWESVELYTQDQVQVFHRSDRIYGELVDQLLFELGRKPRVEQLRASAPLGVARAHAVVANAIIQSAPIVTLPDEAWEERCTRTSANKIRFIPSIDSIWEECARTNSMLHESGLVAWSAPSKSTNCRHYKRFTGVSGACPDSVVARCAKTKGKRSLEINSQA